MSSGDSAQRTTPASYASTGCFSEWVTRTRHFSALHTEKRRNLRGQVPAGWFVKQDDYSMSLTLPNLKVIFISL